MDFPAGAAAEPAAGTTHGHHSGAKGWAVGHAAPAARRRRNDDQLDGGGLRPGGAPCLTSQQSAKLARAGDPRPVS